jgi:FtsZ-binding cell division protein ZapB
MNPETETNLKRLEEKIEQAIILLNDLKQENKELKNTINKLQDRNNQAVEKINFILDNISKLL